MPTYRYLVGELNPASGNGLRDEIPFSSVKFSHVLNRPGGFSANVPLRHPKATRENLDPGRTAVHIERDGVIVWSGMLWVAEASVENATVDVGGEGWWGYLRHRLIRSGTGGPAPSTAAVRIYLAQDQFFIARDLVNYAQAQAGGNVGIIVGSETCGVLRDRTWYHYERKNLGEAVEQLAGVNNGFDFAVDVAYESGLIVKRFHPSYPRRGRITPLAWELGTNLEGLAQTVDATRQADLVDALGAGEGDGMLIATASDPAQLAPSGPYPLLETVVAYKDVSVMATLQSHAEVDLRNYKRPVTRIPTLLARSTAPDTALGTFITGDSVQVKGTDGWISADERMRIQGYEVEIDEDGKETVAVAFAQEEACL